MLSPDEYLIARADLDLDRCERIGIAEVKEHEVRPVRAERVIADVDSLVPLREDLANEASKVSAVLLGKPLRYGSLLNLEDLRVIATSGVDNAVCPARELPALPRLVVGILATLPQFVEPVEALRRRREVSCAALVSQSRTDEPL